MDSSVEGKLYLNGTIQQGCIGITDGKITRIKKILRADNHRSYGKKLILPSATDIHVHFRDPGQTYKEDFATGSRAAACGGVTAVFDMPNTVPATTTLQTLHEKHQIAKNKSSVDYGIYAALTDTNIDTFESLVSLADGFKIFMAEPHSTLKVSKSTVQQALPQLQYANKLLLVHAEMPPATTEQDVPTSLFDHNQQRPASGEETAIQRILQWNETIHAPLHICHLSSCEGLEVLRNHPKEITVGVTPHHLFFDIKHLTNNAHRFKVNPPVRTTFDRKNLWNAMTNQVIDLIESDHAPHTQKEKDQEFSQIPSGVPGVETMFPLFLAEAKHNRISLQVVVDLLCKRPAERLLVSKGVLQEGFDADFIVVDFKSVEKITHDRLHSKCGWSPYEGKEGIFPSDVFLRGDALVEDSEWIGRQGVGRWVGGSGP